MDCPKCNTVMDREDGVYITTLKGQHQVTIGIPYADYYCEECDMYYQWAYGQKGLRNVTKGEMFPEDIENCLVDKIDTNHPIVWQAWEQYEKDFDINWEER